MTSMFSQQRSAALKRPPAAAILCVELQLLGLHKHTDGIRYLSMGLHKLRLLSQSQGVRHFGMGFSFPGNTVSHLSETIGSPCLRKVTTLSAYTQQCESTKCEDEPVRGNRVAGTVVTSFRLTAKNKAKLAERSGDILKIKRKVISHYV
jgi:hypothetical protein